jgi:hypothetical protein
MAKKLIPALLLAALLACSGVGMRPAPCEAGADANEYAAFSAAIDEFSNGRDGTSVVILDHTEVALDPSMATSEWFSPQRCEELIPETETSMVGSYRERIRQPLKLAHEFAIGKNYVMASDEDLKAIPSERMRWAGIRDKYPDAFGVISLSRVGFNPDMTKAVVYISQGWCGIGCGEGVCMLLERRGCKWKVKDRHGIWIS